MFIGIILLIAAIFSSIFWGLYETAAVAVIAFFISWISIKVDEIYN